MSGSNKVYLLAFITLTVVFAAVALRLLTQDIRLENRVTRENTDETGTPANPMETIPNGVVEVSLRPAPVEAIVGQPFPLEVVFAGMDKAIVAADIVLEYDPDHLEYMGVEALHASYLNPRQINDGGKLVLSYVQNPSAAVGSIAPLSMQRIIFRPRAVGNTSITAVVDNSPKSSMVYLDGTESNQIKSVAPVEVVIK